MALGATSWRHSPFVCGRTLCCLVRCCLMQLFFPVFLSRWFFISQPLFPLFPPLHKRLSSTLHLSTKHPSGSGSQKVLSSRLWPRSAVTRLRGPLELPTESAEETCGQEGVWGGETGQRNPSAVCWGERCAVSVCVSRHSCVVFSFVISPSVANPQPHCASLPQCYLCLYQ